MTEISKLHLPKQQNIQINTCRLYLQVATLSDIVNLDGRTVNHHFLDGNKSIQPNSTVRWPNQPLPSPQAWHLWKKVRKVFTISNYNTLLHRQQLK